MGGVYIGLRSSITLENTSIGEYSSVGPAACFLSARANIIIGDYVMSGPHVFIINSDHRIDMIGRCMSTARDEEKYSNNDQDIIIKDDVWIGANAIILKGVIVGAGSAISAGSVVTQNVKPYSIVGGVPAKLIRKRFSKEKIRKHRELLNLK